MSSDARRPALTVRGLEMLVAETLAYGRAVACDPELAASPAVHHLERLVETLAVVEAVVERIAKHHPSHGQIDAEATNYRRLAIDDFGDVIDGGWIVEEGAAEVERRIDAHSLSTESGEIIYGLTPGRMLRIRICTKSRDLDIVQTLTLGRCLEHFASRVTSGFEVVPGAWPVADDGSAPDAGGSK